MTDKNLFKITDYKDLLTKIEYDLERYRGNNHLYALIDCIMTLNSLPEWISKSTDASKRLKNLAKTKIIIMKEGWKDFDETLLESEIDHQIKFIRLYCNHSKHNTDSSKIPSIISKYGSTIPAIIPHKLCNIIAIGEHEYDAEYLITEVYNFWKNEILK